MPKVVILGSSNAIPDEAHENSHMALVGSERFVLIDCTSTPIVRLRQAGLDVNNLTDLILTHFHPDHVSGVPLLLMNLWLLSRQRELRIHGLDHTLDRFETMMDLFGWENWPGFFPVEMNRLPEQEMAIVQETDEWKIYSSPVSHIIPNVGLRIEFNESKKVFAYSGDTEPSTQVVKLAKDADVLIHESTGLSWGHSDAAQAGEIAKQANARKLYLIHYANGTFKDENMLTKAEQTFDGPVSLAKDFLELEF
jgi:ribonuclease Z